METKEKKNAASRGSGRQEHSKSKNAARSGGKAPATKSAARPEEKTSGAKSKNPSAHADKHPTRSGSRESRGDAQKRAVARELEWAQQHQQEAQSAQVSPNPRQSLPEEEIHRPTPSQERHAPREQRPERPPVAKRPVSKEKREEPQNTAPAKAPTRRRIRKPKSNAPVAIYTQPAPFNLNRLLIQLLSITAVVLALTLALSIFFKVEVITVSGADTYSEWAIREASGINEGDSLLTFSRARAGARIRAELPYVDHVRFGIKLPNTVIIDVVELEVVYAIQDTQDNWWYITSEGRVVEQADRTAISSYTQIQGVRIQYPESNAMAVAESDTPVDATSPTDASGETTATVTPGETVPVAETNEDRLRSALEILQALESNDIVGEVASINLENLSDIILWYGTRYQVELGDNTRLSYKIECMQDTIAQLSDYEMGVLDVSFIFWTDKVEYAPFDD